MFTNLFIISGALFFLLLYLLTSSETMMVTNEGLFSMCMFVQCPLDKRIKSITKTILII